MIERVGFIGLGLMGWRMAASLQRGGFALTVWNRARDKAGAFAREHGAEVAETPAALAAQADAVVTMVVDGDAVEAVLTGPSGVAEGARQGLLCIDCSTIGASACRRVGKALASHGIGFVDAPVSGSLPGAESATLTIMVGGTDEDVGRARPVLNAMGRLIVHVGDLGQGQAMKVISNTMASANAVALGEALLLAKAEGVDLDAFCRVIGGTAGASTMSEQKAGPMRRHDYTTLFKADQMLKDVRLCLEDAQAAGIPFTAGAYAGQILAAASGRGYGDADYAALIEPLEGLAGKRL